MIDETGATRALRHRVGHETLGCIGLTERLNNANHFSSCPGNCTIDGRRRQAQRLDRATMVMSEIMATPDKAIPRDLLEKAHCIVVVPDEKSEAFLVGA